MTKERLEEIEKIVWVNFKACIGEKSSSTATRDLLHIITELSSCVVELQDRIKTVETQEAWDVLRKKMAA